MLGRWLAMMEGRADRAAGVCRGAVWLVCWALLWPLAACAQPQAPDRVLERAWWLDDGAAQTPAQLHQAVWQPAAPLMSLGYTPKVLWMRLRVRADVADQPLVLRLRPSYLDDVRLFTPDAGRPDAWREHRTGDLVPYAARERASSSLALVWRPAQAGVQTLYVRVATTSSLIFYVEVLDELQAQFRDAELDGFVLFYLSVMLCMVLWALVDGRGRANGWFLAAQLNTIVMALSLLGYLARMLPSGWSVFAHEVTGISVCLSTMLYPGFYRSMLLDNRPSRASQRAALLTMGLFPCQMLAMAMGHHQWAVKSNAFAAIFLMVPVVLWMACTTRQDGLLTRRTWYVVATFQSLFVCVVMLPLLGVSSLQLFKMHSTLLVGLSGAVLMFAVLMRRSARAAQAARDNRHQVDLLAQRLELEQAHRREQRQFLDMLGHELKTPLMTIRLAGHALAQSLPSDDTSLQRRVQRIDVSSQAMSQVLERVLEANRMDDASLPVQCRALYPATLLTELQAGLAHPERVTIEAAPDVCVWTDPDQVRVVLANLLDNACKYSPAGTPVQASVRTTAHDCTVVVCNELGALAAPDAAHVFQKYHRAEEVKALPGAGVGLWLGHNLARRLGGSLTVHTVDQSVEFHLCLPLSTMPEIPAT